MNFFRNKSIKTQIFSGFSIIILFCLILVIINIIGLKYIENNCQNLIDGAVSRYEYSSDVLSSFENIEKNIYSICADISSGNSGNISETTAAVYADFATVEYKLEQYMAAIEKDSSIAAENKEELIAKCSNVKVLLNERYADMAEKIINYARRDDKNSIDALNEERAEIEKEVFMTICELSRADKIFKEENVSATNELMHRNIVLELIIGIVLIVCGIIAAESISHAITKPLKGLRENANAVAKGDFNVTSTDMLGSNEVSQVSYSISRMIETLDSLLSEIKNVSEKSADGNINIKIDENKYNGKYSEVANSVNSIIKIGNDVTNDVIECIENYANGNFDFQCRRFTGDRESIHERLDECQANLTSIRNEINEFIIHISEGKLDYSADTAKYRNDWYEIISSLNLLMDKIYAPINDISVVMKKVSNSEFNVLIENEYSGEFGILKDSINSVITSLNRYIREITEILHNIAQQNLNITINESFDGDFSAVKTAIDTIIGNFNRLVGEIKLSSDSVVENAKNAEKSNNILADNTLTQKNAVIDLVKFTDTIIEKTETNTINIKKVNELTASLENDTKSGNKIMHEMVGAIEKITETSKNISAILKTINEISFQTNILALNAAVEAARAGVHGKGFAIVADEVRGLATRSSKSAAQTEELIQQSIDSIETGTRLALETAGVFETFTKQIGQLNKIADDVAESSEEQSNYIIQMSEAIVKIENAVKVNAEASDKNRVIGERLAEQAGKFRNEVSKFKLRETTVN